MLRVRFTVKPVNAKSALLSIAAGVVAVTLHRGVPGAHEGGTVLSAQALREIAQVEAEIDRIEAQTIERLATPPDNQVPATRPARQVDTVRQAAFREPQRSLRFLPHAGNGLHRSGIGAEPHHRLLSRLGAHAGQ